MHFPFNEKVHFSSNIIVLSSRNSVVYNHYRVTLIKDGWRCYTLYNCLCKQLKDADIMALCWFTVNFHHFSFWTECMLYIQVWNKWLLLSLLQNTCGVNGWDLVGRPELSTLSRAYAGYIFASPSLPTKSTSKMLILRSILKIAVHHKRHFFKSVWRPLTPSRPA